jgi:hypothetical protein
MEEKVYDSFHKLVLLLVRTYRVSRHASNVNEIARSMKSIYQNKKAFEYTFERFYSEPKNPFTTAYHQFMNYSQSGVMDFDDSIYLIADGILTRMLKELEEGEFKVF